MEWLWSFVTAIVGWWIGHRQKAEDRRRAIEEGAQAAFNIEHGVVSFLRERDRQRLKDAFKDVDLSDTKQVRAVAQVAGELYAEIIRRDAFGDARVSNFSQHDRESWKRAFDQEMPSIGYQQGYLQAIRDVIAGAGQVAPSYLEHDGIASFEAWAKHERNLGFSWVDGKSVGRQLLIFDRLRKPAP
jgi:hypothetical protein